MSAAIVALELLPELEAEARKRQEATGKNAPRDELGRLRPPVSTLIPSPDLTAHRQSKAVDAAAAIVGVCGSSVQQAKAVRTRDTKRLRVGGII